MNTEKIHNTTPATRQTTSTTQTHINAEAYTKPTIEIIAIDNEGILASSSGTFGDGGGYDGW